MEFASYLAGERWSDHPSCTHPALAFLARMVNDCSSDTERSRLAVLIPSVIGLNGSDRSVEVAIALRAASVALPIASEERQRALAVGILSCQRILERMGVEPAPDLAAAVDSAMQRTPLAVSWARDFVGSYRLPTGNKAASRLSESVIRISVLGIAGACIENPDARLRALLTAAIEDSAAILRPTSVEDRAPSARPLQFEEPIVGSRS
ncbi:MULTISPECIES: hypothetical protein [unclassified Cryobacterium]|uniref:hypothetical protein n=1 Tax=unclassified Cryobacterium TaxID=2649013 RepID=UPI001445CAAB|nr:MULTISPECIES: hypothetical protein [unclassified Cryobacterium]